MIENVSLRPTTNQEFIQDLDQIVAADQYGTVQNVTVVDGQMMIETDTHRITLQMPDVPPPSETTDPEGALEGLGGDIDTLFALLETLTKTLQEMRKSSQLSRELEHQAQITQLKDAANKIREAGQEGLSAAIAGFAVAVVLSVASVAASAVGGVKAVKLDAAKAADPANDALKGMAKSAAAWGSTGQATGQAVQPTSNVASAAGQQQQAETQAEGKEAEATAEVHQFAADKENTQMQALQDLIRSVLDKLKTYIELKNQAMEATTKA